MSPREINMERASWIHNKGGVDYGPYDSETVSTMIVAGEILREDGLTDQYSGRQCAPAEIPAFDAALDAFEEQQREAAIAHEAEASYSKLKQRRLIPIFLVLIILLSVAMSWDFIMTKLDPSSRHTALAAVTIPITPEPDLRILAFPHDDEHGSNSDASSSKVDANSIRVRARTTPNPRKKKKKTPQRAAAEAPQQQVQEFDFADDDLEDDDSERLASPLGASELRQFMSEKLKPAVMRCVRVHREELVLGSYKVHLKLKPSGALSLSAITPSDAKVPSLKGCLDLQVKRNQFRVFTGAERKLELPIKVQ